MSDVFEVAQSVLEVLRIDLHEWKRSPDLHEKVQRCAARMERQIGHEIPAASVVPAFRFRPLATAPATRVDFSDSSSSVCGDVMSTKAIESSVSRRTGGKQKVRLFNAPLEPSFSTQHAQDGSLAKTPRRIETGEHPSAPSSRPNTLVRSSNTEPSRWETALRRLSRAAEQLYADMAERGQIMMAAEIQPAHLWRRRVDAPRDAELRRAVRDYLYRMNILSCSGVGILKNEEGGAGPLEVSPVFADAVMNGTALCQLVSTLLLEGGDGPSLLPRDAVPCRCPCTLEEIRVNYAQALSALHGAPPAAQEHIPSAAWSILPEDVVFNSTPTPLLELFVHLISTYLPSPEELPTWKVQMCWQPPADRPTFSPISPLELAAAEKECCAFLHAYGVVPDAAVYSLPGPECLVPSPLMAPFMANWKAYVARTDALPCLLLPSVWPYLCNGVLLVLLARRSGIEAAARAVPPASHDTFFPNPRTTSCCMANISSAYRSFQAVSTLKSSLQFFTAESAAAVLQGDRLHIVSVLLHLRAVLDGRESRTLLTLQRQNASVKKSLTPTRDGSTLYQTPTASNSRSSSAASPSVSSTLKWLEPATIAKGVACRYRTTSDRMPPTPSPSPSVHFHAVPDRTNQRSIVPPSSPQDARPASRSKDSDAVQWLCHLVGPDFRYTAVDESFSFDARHLTVSQPCLIFSDGVLLAHVIGLLECRRCDYLDCVQPATKRAAKLFGVRRCLEFLRSSAGMVWEFPLLDEALVNGSAEGVLSLLRALRSHYGLMHRSNLSHADEKGI